MNMRKRICAFFLTVVMLCTLLPPTALFAAAEDTPAVCHPVCEKLNDISREEEESVIIYFPQKGEAVHSEKLFSAFSPETVIDVDPAFVWDTAYTDNGVVFSNRGAKFSCYPEWSSMVDPTRPDLLEEAVPEINHGGEQAGDYWFIERIGDSSQFYLCAYARDEVYGDTYTGCKIRLGPVEFYWLGHSAAELVEENRTEPSCTEAGSFDTVSYCKNCGAELERITTKIPALGHDLVLSEQYDAFICSRCDYSEPLSAAAEGSCGETLTWKLYQPSGILVITGSGDMYDYLDGTAPWKDCYIRYISLPNGITSLGNYAFAGCTEFKELMLPESLLWIGDDTFKGCTALRDLWFYGPAPDNKEHSPDVFYMPFFEDLYRDVTFHFIPGQDGWEYPTYCGYKTDWWTPDGAATSGQCGENLYWSYDEEIGVFEITGTGPMWHCDEFLSGCDYWPDMTVPAWYPFHDDITEVRLPEGMTTIGDTAFRDCTKLESIAIPETVEGIGAYTFYHCTSLKEVVIHDAVEFIGIGAFRNCNALESAVIGDGIYGIGCEAFYGCRKLQSVCFGNGILIICQRAFEDCSALTEMTLPASIKELEPDAFTDCDSLKRVYFLGNAPEELWAFYSNYTDGPLDGLTLYYLPGTEGWTSPFWHDYPTLCTEEGAMYEGICGDHMTWKFYAQTGTLIISGIGDMYDFQNGTFAPWHSFCDDILSVRLPDGLTYIGALAFAECHNLKSITIPESVSCIGHSAFYYCTGLEKATLPTSVKTVESYAFANCWELSDCPLSEGLETIGFAAFMGTALTEAIIPDTVTYIEASAFCGCEKLKKVSVPDGIMRIYDETFYYCKALTDVTLPDSVMCIDYAAFFSCTGLTGISLPANLIYLGSDAFRDCTALKSVTVPAGVTEISVGAFENCRALTSVTLPANLTGIEAFAFADCISLEQITLPAKVETIGDYAFSGCSKLHHIHCLGDLPKLGVDPLKYGSDETTFCYLPDAFGWEFCDYPAELFAVVETVHATCTEQGSADYVCSCGESYPAGETPALGHNYVDGTCARCGEADPNYIPPAPVDPCEGYTDIDREAWYHDAADFVIERGLMGFTSTETPTFEPSTVCTRSMIVMILYNIAGNPNVEYEAKFADVADEKWYTDAVMWAYQNGIVSGYDNGRFGPNDKVTREQMAVLLKGYADSLGEDTSKTADLSEFPDGDKATWSKNYICWAVAERLISGKAIDGETYLDPQGNATRAEVAVLIRNFVLNILETK